jgi:hypothetical protein
MSKDLEYQLPLSHVIADYDVKLDNVLKHPALSEQDKDIISSHRYKFTLGRYGIVGLALGECYRMYKR